MDELDAYAAAVVEIHTFAHCKTCTVNHQTPRIEVGITRSGIRVDCKKHGLIVHLTPDELRAQISRGPQCDCCPGGMHRS
jgi:hypothetical protein